MNAPDQAPVARPLPKCRYMFGINVAPRTTADAKALIGKRVCYLLNSDIDRSGRGYLSPQYGTIMDVHRKHFAIDDPGNFSVSFSSIAEMTELKRYTFHLQCEEDVSSVKFQFRHNGLVALFRNTVPVAEGSPEVSVEIETGAELDDVREMLSKLAVAKKWVSTLHPLNAELPELAIGPSTTSKTDASL